MSIANEVLAVPVSAEPEASAGPRPARILSGWMSPEETQNCISTSVIASAEDAVAKNGTASANRDNVSQRVGRGLSPAEVEGDRTLLDAVAAAPPVQTTLAGQNYRIAWLDLRNVIAVQKLVHLDYRPEAIDRAAASEEELVALCIPTSPGLPLQVSVDQQADGRAVRLSSPSPNLRLGNAFFDPNEMMVKIPVGFGWPFVTVAIVRGRYILTDGYHRAVALVSRGVTVIPAIVTEIEAYPFAGGPASPFIDQETVFGATPPVIVDYDDDGTTMTITRRRCHKVASVQSQDFEITV